MGQQALKRNARLLKIETENEHFGPGRSGTSGVWHLLQVVHVVGVVGVERICQPNHEFQFGTQFEVWQIEVTTNTDLKEYVVLLHLHIVTGLCGQIYHRCQARHDVGTVIVETLGCENYVKVCSYVNGLHRLILYCRSACLLCLQVVVELQVSGAEVHLWCHTELEILVHAELRQHADIESGVPFGLIYRYVARNLSTVLQSQSLWTDVLKLRVLDVSAHYDTKMYWPKVGVGTVLHGTRL